MKIFPFRAVFPDEDIIASPTSFVSDAKLNFKEYYRKLYFERSSREAFYIHEIETAYGKHYGLTVNVDVNEFIDESILPHEKTLKSKEQISMQLIINREAIIKPILLTHAPVPELRNILIKQTKKSKPEREIFFEDKNEKHSFWPIRDGLLIDKISNLFRKKVKNAYIADGHHRAKVFVHLFGRKKNKLLKFDRIMSSFFAFDDIKILDYNRLVNIENNISSLQLVARLSRIGDLHPIPAGLKPIRKHQLTFFIENEWFAFEWKKEIIFNYEKEGVVLDHDIFNDLVLRKILKITDVQSDTRIKYLEGILSFEEIRERTMRSAGKVAFLLYPVQIEEMKQLADHGKTLPPKSTYFVPRLYNGLIASDLSRH